MRRTKKKQILTVSDLYMQNMSKKNTHRSLQRFQIFNRRLWRSLLLQLFNTFLWFLIELVNQIYLNKKSYRPLLPHLL